jgi:hypothetical protein
MLITEIDLIAATCYVWQDSPGPAPPYTNWANAARVIQDAVDAAAGGDEIVVTNGTYATGGRAVYGTMTNRVAVDRPLTLRSVNGPQFTIIQGYQVPGTTNSDEAIRCVYLTNDAVLSGFTLTNGATRSAGDSGREQSGAGVWCESTNALVSNCVVVDNSARASGGGAYRGTLNNCALIGNSASAGGGASGATLNNCTLTGNSASDGGGASGGTLSNCALAGNSASDLGGGAYCATLNNCTLTGNSAYRGGGASGYYFGHGRYPCTLNNCIVCFNTAATTATEANYYLLFTFNYSCTTPLPTAGTGNMSVDPQLASTSHISANSPCRGVGAVAYATGTDIDGEPWGSPPSMGCDEPSPASATGNISVALQAAYTNVATGFTVAFSGNISGNITDSRWEFGDGTIVSNRLYVSHAWGMAGSYPVILRAYNANNSAGAAATVLVQVRESISYVAADSTNAVAPYSSWATAARTIQDAVDATDATVVGGTILVTNGLYSSGGKAVYGTMTNRVVVDKLVTVRSVNGPQFTVIEGYQLPGTTNGDNAIRCVYLTNAACLAGFTLTHGATRSSGDYIQEQSGGGVWCGAPSTVVSNCVVTDNSASGWGGGVFGGWGYEGTINNCGLTLNSGYSGGGACGGRLNSCTLVGNSAIHMGGGVYGGAVNNCIVYFNTATYGPNWFIDLTGTVIGAPPAFDELLNYCCTTPPDLGTPPALGIGNITNEPAFVNLAAGDFHLRADSPCIDAGNPDPAYNDVCLTPCGVSQGTVTNDIGAFGGPGACGWTSLCAPTITTQPQDQVGCLSHSATFTVGASGTGSLSYQWYFNTSTLLGGATNSSLTLTNLQSTNSGKYWVVVSSQYGSTPSALAQLTLYDPYTEIEVERYFDTYIGAGLYIAGRPGATYVLKYTADLRKTDWATWTPLATHTMDPSGWWFYLDEDSPFSPTRFYQARPNP